MLLELMLLELLPLLLTLSSTVHACSFITIVFDLLSPLLPPFL
jgi:hypothetical protein